MSRYRPAAVLLAVFLGAPQAGTAGDPHAVRPEAVKLALTPRLRAALQAEMAGLRTGIAELADTLASGEWDRTAAHAARIRDSYILKQKLSRAELDRLERSLPADFLAMDERFHRHAGNLAHAAREHDHELAVFYYSRMLEGCGGCHARYATHVFPGFRQAEPAPHAH